MNDIKFAIRQLLKNPAFSAVVLLTLALGIGVNTSMFSALRALMNRPLPYMNPDGLVEIFQTSGGSSREPHHSVPNFLDYQRSGTFEFTAALNDRQFNLAEPGRPAEQVRGLLVSPDLFPLLGVGPELGRVFSSQENRPGQDRVVILDHGFWQRRFAGDPGIIGRALRLDGEVVTVVGVMPARFHDLMLMGPAYMWRPLTFTAAQQQERGNQFLKCIARLKPGASLSQAQAATDVLAKRQLQEYPDNSPDGLRLIPLAKASMPPMARTILLSVMALAGFVLLIACANLANLQFARMTSRSREFALRSALGASRRRLIEQILVECLLLAFLGGALGLVLALWSNEILCRQIVADGEQVLRLPLNLAMVAFALAASTVSGLAFGFVPGWLASRKDVSAALKAGARGTTSDPSQHRVQHSLVIAEVALALMLFASAGLLVKGLRGFTTQDPGWQVEKVTLGYLTLPEAKYGDGSSLRAFADRLEEELKAIPGVEEAALCWNLPIRQFNVTSSFGIDGREAPPKGTVLQCCVNGVTPGYFTALGMRLLEGRAFSSADTTNRPPVVIINEAMAHAFWPAGSPLGQRINGAEIVGVVCNVRFPANPTSPGTGYQTYRPFAQEPRGFLNIAVRGKVQAESLRRAVANVDPDQPLGQPGPAGADVESSLDNWGVGGKLLTVFAILGLSLAALGIYGVFSAFVARRTGEIGVRMALGAQLGNVLWLVLGRGLRLALTGAALGLLGAFGLARLLASLLPELPRSDLWVILSATVLFLGIAMLACWLPARRAARVDPIIALRAE